MLFVSMESRLLALAIQQNIFEGTPQRHEREKGLWRRLFRVSVEPNLVVVQLILRYGCLGLCRIADRDYRFDPDVGGYAQENLYIVLSGLIHRMRPTPDLDPAATQTQRMGG
jgi:hypothetical protein